MLEIRPANTLTVPSFASRTVNLDVDLGALAIRYVFSTTITDSDPGSGKLRLSATQQNAALTIRADTLDINGSDVSGILDAFDDSTSSTKGSIRIYKVSDPTKWLTFAVTSVASPSGYRNLAVSNLAGSGTSPFEDGDAVLLSFTPAGDKGQKGDTGNAGVDSGLTAADRPALAAITPAAGKAVLLTEFARGGEFVWRSGNYTSFVNADIYQLRYVESTVPGFGKSVGVWRRASALLNSDFGTDIYATSSDQQWGGPFGGPWGVTSREELQSQSTTAGSRAVKAFVHKTPGTGQNGPNHGDYSVFMSTEKLNHLGSANPGEIDVLCATFTQGQYSDCSAFLGDGTKVGGGDGGSIMIETANKWVDGAGTAVRRIQVGVNFLEGAGGLSGGTGYGLWAEAQAGSLYAGVCIDQSQSSTGAAWQNAFVFAKDRSTPIARIDGAGRALMSNGSAGIPGYGFQENAGLGMFRLSADQLGFAMGGVLRSYISSSGHTLPGTDNTYYLGSAGSGRWAGAYFVNAPVVSSDERLKTDIEESPLGLDFITSLRPVAYRLKHGGTRIEHEEVEVEVEEPVTEKQEVIHEEKHFDGQKVVVNKKTVVEDVPLYNTVEVLNEDGSPALDEQGNQATYAVPRMQKVKRVESRPVEVREAGKRLHYGLIAQEVKRQLDASGVEDFGGYVVDDINDPDSLLSLRYEEFIAPLIKAVQELAGEIENLKSKNRR